MSNITRGVRNKNPFNIRFSNNSWLGKIKTNKKDFDYEEFREIDYGIRAGVNLLRTYIHRGYNTTYKILHRYAPASENDTSKYIEFVCSYTHLSSTDSIELSSLAFFNLCHAICLFESNYDLTYEHYLSVCNRFRIL